MVLPILISVAETPGESAARVVCVRNPAARTVAAAAVNNFIIEPAIQLLERETYRPVRGNRQGRPCGLSQHLTRPLRPHAYAGRESAERCFAGYQCQGRKRRARERVRRSTLCFRELRVVRLSSVL